LPPVVLSLINDPNVISSCLKNEAMKNYIKDHYELLTEQTPPLLLNTDTLPLSPEDVDVSATASTASALGVHDDYSEYPSGLTLTLTLTLMNLPITIMGAIVHVLIVVRVSPCLLLIVRGVLLRLRWVRGHPLEIQ